MPVILALVAPSMNDALGAATRAHVPMFRRLGYEMRELNFASGDANAVLQDSIRAGDIELVFGAMGFGADIRTNTDDGADVNLWEALRLPFVSLMGDTPGYFFDRHTTPTPWHAILYFFPDHYKTRKRFPLRPALSGVIPPIPFDATDASAIDFGAKVSGRLLFLKNGNDPEKLVRNWRETLPTPSFLLLAELASHLANELDTDAGADIDALVTSAFASKGWNIEECLTLRLLFLSQLDDYLRRVKSTLMGRALADLPVDIQGFNWEHVNFTGKRAHYRLGGDYVESGAQIRSALGVIDMSPNTTLAPHDRPMRSMGLHTLCLTNHQQFFERNFSQWAEFTFNFSVDSICDLVSRVIANPKRYVDLGREVAKTFASRSTPEDFGQYLIDTAAHIRAANLGGGSGLPDYFVWPQQIGLKR